ncbi:hypothetical protein AVHY2522_13640 [Acidovorax sp. SUPP2522]|uniref:hypothetical protein n=1 Tax=unclassified Acidovorax TaxID=2684926 RepID=UPI00234BCE3F|nr:MULTISPECIES: hypothetical protein [unclassified Acidovorax]WCM96268.1 hypothetical protein M5C96_17755 [Acidovorax sp. GBBC 1281]GKT16983.1 hypothetical protein AVHY2522_13640 [Acidovorax sp. SUPP2522]
MTDQPSKPGSMVARPSDGPVAAAAASICAIPHGQPHIDAAAWYDQHAELAHRLLHLAVRAATLPPGAEDREVNEALAALLLHAREIVGYELPTLLAKDGTHTIPFERFATARAKVSALLLELVRTRAELAALQSETKGPDHAG